MGKSIKRTPQSKLARLEASVAGYRSKARSLQAQNANLQKFVKALCDALAEASARPRKSQLPESEARPKQAIAVLMAPTAGYTKSYTEIEAKLRAGGLRIPPSLAMLAAAERDESADQNRTTARPRMPPATTSSQ